MNKHTDDTLSKATDDYIRAVEGTKDISQRLKTINNITLKQLADAEKSLEMFKKMKADAEDRMLALTDPNTGTASPYEIKEWLMRMEQYTEEPSNGIHS